MPEIPWDYVVVAALLLGFYVVFFGGKVAPAQAKKLVEEGAMLLDVRTQGEFAGGHLPKAVNIPLSELSARIAEVPKDQPVVVYCASGMRSASAKRLLVASGRKAVHDLGGMSRYPS